MKASCLTFILLAAAATATPLESRQSWPNTDQRKTLLVENISWQRDGATITGVKFDAAVYGTSLTYNCDTASDKSGSPFQPDKIHRCAEGAPITFAYTNQNGQNLNVWYNDPVKSYIGNAAMDPDKAENIVVFLSEVEASPPTTPEVSP